MNTWIALLRGINVGRAKRVAMADLRCLLEELGYANVRTLLNSGNAVFDGGRGATGRAALGLQRVIAERLGLQVPVVVISAQELDAIVAANPLPQASDDPSRFLVAFVQQADSLSAARPIAAAAWSPEAFALGTQAAYLWCADGIIDSKLAKAFARATGDAATARNWATVLKLQAMSRG